VKEELRSRLLTNRGQKLQIGSTNLNVDNPTAAQLGVKFNKGANDTTFAIIDEAQFRTLTQLDASNARALGENTIAANERRQDTIVGTDALLANDWVANAFRAGERTNVLDINGNPVELPHDRYILIDNGRFLTAVRAGQMRHWTEASEVVTFATVPEEVEVPAVGHMLRLEKTLVNPATN